MAGKDWWSERMVFGAIIVIGYMLVIGAAAYLPMNGLSRDVVLGAVGSLGTAVGVIVQAVFRTDKADKQNAETMATLARAATGSAP